MKKIKFDSPYEFGKKKRKCNKINGYNEDWLCYKQFINIKQEEIIEKNACNPNKSKIKRRNTCLDMENDVLNEIVKCGEEDINNEKASTPTLCNRNIEIMHMKKTEHVNFKQKMKQFLEQQEDLRNKNRSIPGRILMHSGLLLDAQRENTLEDDNADKSYKDEEIEKHQIYLLDRLNKDMLTCNRKNKQTPKFPEKFIELFVSQINTDSLTLKFKIVEFLSNIGAVGNLTQLMTIVRNEMLLYVSGCRRTQGLSTIIAYLMKNLFTIAFDRNLYCSILLDCLWPVVIDKDERILLTNYHSDFWELICGNNYLYGVALERIYREYSILPHNKKLLCMFLINKIINSYITNKTNLTLIDVVVKITNYTLERDCNEMIDVMLRSFYLVKHGALRKDFKVIIPNIFEKTFECIKRMADTRVKRKLFGVLWIFKTYNYRLFSECLENFNKKRIFNELYNNCNDDLTKYIFYYSNESDDYEF